MYRSFTAQHSRSSEMCKLTRGLAYFAYLFVLAAWLDGHLSLSLTRICRTQYALRGVWLCEKFTERFVIVGNIFELLFMKWSPPYRIPCMESIGKLASLHFVCIVLQSMRAHVDCLAWCQSGVFVTTTIHIHIYQKYSLLLFGFKRQVIARSLSFPKKRKNISIYLLPRIVFEAIVNDFSAFSCVESKQMKK